MLNFICFLFKDVSFSPFCLVTVQEQLEVAIDFNFSLKNKLVYYVIKID
jgi:hypothetical protein